jgi:hypothetical protein
MKRFVCKRIRLFSFLSEKGFVPLTTDKDKYNNNFLVWIYLETPQLLKAIDEYYKTVPVK